MLVEQCSSKRLVGWWCTVCLAGVDSTQIGWMELDIRDNSG